MPNAMIEAMAAGLASVVTAVGSIPSNVEDGVHALLVPPKNKLMLEESILQLINDHELREKISKNSHNMAKIKYSSKLSLEKIGNIIGDHLQN